MPRSVTTMPRSVTSGSLPKMKRARLLGDQAYDQLQRAILRRDLAPGTPLSVPKLAEQLGISRSPVREAVLRLTSVGLAVNAAHKGAVVAEVRIDDLDSLFEVREPLEGIAARRAASRATAGEIKQLRAIVDAHEELVESGEVASQVELDIAFHKRVRDIADSADLTAALGRIQLRAHLALESLWGVQGTSRRSLDFHWQILEAIESGNVEAAEVAARAHIAEVRARISDVFAADSDRGVGS